jgi:hypothetical protein
MRGLIWPGIARRTADCQSLKGGIRVRLAQTHSTEARNRCSRLVDTWQRSSGIDTSGNRQEIVIRLVSWTASRESMVRRDAPIDRQRRALVADWSRAGISYTGTSKGSGGRDVADWSRAGINYTKSFERLGRPLLRIGRGLGLTTPLYCGTIARCLVADWSRAGINYTEHHRYH